MDILIYQFQCVINFPPFLITPQQHQRVIHPKTSHLKDAGRFVMSRDGQHISFM